MRAGLTEEGTVLDGPAVGVEALLQCPREGGLWGQGVVDGKDGDTQLLSPGLEVGFVGLGGLGHKATAMDVHDQVRRAGCLLGAWPKLQGPRTLGLHQAVEILTVLGVREEEVGEAGAAWASPHQGDVLRQEGAGVSSESRDSMEGRGASG